MIRRKEGERERERERERSQHHLLVIVAKSQKTPGIEPIRGLFHDGSKVSILAKDCVCRLPICCQIYYQTTVTKRNT